MPSCNKCGKTITMVEKYLNKGLCRKCKNDKDFNTWFTRHKQKVNEEFFGNKKQ